MESHRPGGAKAPNCAQEASAAANLREIAGEFLEMWSVALRRHVTRSMEGLDNTLRSLTRSMGEEEGVTG